MLDGQLVPYIDFNTGTGPVSRHSTIAGRRQRPQQGTSPMSPPVHHVVPGVFPVVASGLRLGSLRKNRQLDLSERVLNQMTVSLAGAVTTAVRYLTLTWSRYAVDGESHFPTIRGPRVAILPTILCLFQVQWTFFSHNPLVFGLLWRRGYVHAARTFSFRSPCKNRCYCPLAPERRCLHRKYLTGKQKDSILRSLSDRQNEIRSAYRGFR